MASTVTHSTGTITPTAIEGYESEREAYTVVGDILNRSNPDVTFRAFGLRTGSFRLIFADEAAALAAEAALSVPQVLTINNPDVASLVMSFVIAGGSLSLQQDTHFWRLLVPFHEVTP
jgi:hypothetical protein